MQWKRKRKREREEREEGGEKREERREKLNFKIWTASARKNLRFWFWRICTVNETGEAGHQREALIFPPSTPQRNNLSDLDDCSRTHTLSRVHTYGWWYRTDRTCH